MFSRLEAVNIMLTQAGQTPVTSLSSDASADTTVAEQILDQATLDAQLRGLANNYYKLTIQPDAVTKEITLPAGTMRFDVISYPGNDRIVVSRNGKLFSPERGAFTFDEEIEVCVFTELAWDDIELAVRRSIAATAAARYGQVVNGDAGVMRRLYQEEQDFRGVAKSADVRSRQRNIYDSSREAFNARNRRLSTGRSANRYPGV